MQTRINETFLQTVEGREAESILRACVHCGFCTATCPTYQLLGDELDGPRGRIYLIKQMLEGEAISSKTRLHLDRCLTCRSCETTCPSGVRYGRLLDIGRGIIESRLPRSAWHRFLRFCITRVIPYPRRLRWMLRMATPFRRLAPEGLRIKIPPLAKAEKVRLKNQQRRMLVLDGCVQSVSTPQTNVALRKILDRLGIELLSASAAVCCGGVDYHLGQHTRGEEFMRRNIDAWWPHIEQGVEAIVITASGCGVTVKEYGDLLAHDAEYADKAKRISELARDPGEILASEPLKELGKPGEGKRIAFHAPCTLQHGQALNGLVESILTRLGFTLTEIPNAHLCCGSAGTYSILQPKISSQLLSNKLEALGAGGPQIIATANIGCQLHLGSQATVPVVHWLELIGNN
jgi:glycolate oxidase iron-sulfur subunit